MIRRQITLPVDADRLWDALTDPDEASAWFGGRMDWDLQEGAPLAYRDDDGTAKEGKVDVVRPGRYLRYRWWEGPDGSGATEVTYLLEPAPDGTRLTIQERGVKPSPSAGAGAASARLALQIPGEASEPRWTRWDSVLASMWAVLAAPAFGAVARFGAAPAFGAVLAFGAVARFGAAPRFGAVLAAPAAARFGA